MPGNTSTAVISWESVSTTIAALCPSKRRLLLLCPWHISGSCTDIIRSRLTPSLRLTPPSARSTSWSSNCPSSSAAATIRCRSALSSLNSPCACRDNSNSRSASATILASSAVRARLSLQSMAASPFTLEPRYLSYPRAWAHSLTGACSTAAGARNNLTIPSANRLQVSFTAPRPRMLVGSNATRIPRPFRYPDSRAKRRLDSNTSRTLPCRTSWARNTCSVLLAKGRSSASIPNATFHRATFQRRSKSARALASASLTRSWDWSSRATSRQAGRHAVPAVVRAVELSEIGVPEQPAPQRCQEAVEAFLPHVVQVQPVLFPKSPLVRSLSQHSQPSLSLLTPSIAADPAAATFRPDF